MHAFWQVGAVLMLPEVDENTMAGGAARLPGSRSAVRDTRTVDIRREAVRALSRTLFGAGYRIEVCAALDNGMTFCGGDLVLLLGDPPGKGQVSSELKKLREAGLVRTLKAPRSDRTRPFVAADVGLWASCRELKSRAEQDADEAVLRDAAVAALASRGGAGRGPRQLPT